MEKLENAVVDLIGAIKDTEEYRKYVEQKEGLKQFPEFKTQIDEYRRRNFAMQMENSPAFEKIEQFEREYEGFREDRRVSDFLAAELAFCRMMQKMELRIIDSLDFE